MCCNKNIFVVFNKNKIKVKEGIKYEDNDYCIVVNNKVFNDDKNKYNFETIINLYKNNVDFSLVFPDLFTMLIIDKKNHTAKCIQDYQADSIPIYYFRYKNEIIITNKLANIISNYPEYSFEMNNRNIIFFLKKGYIDKGETLIKNIYKTIPAKDLIINFKKKIKVYYKLKKQKYFKNKQIEVNDYIDEFNNLISKKSYNKDVFLTLSSGYDSNFIFSFLNKTNNIEAFSVGGIIGINETPIVKENVNKYKKVNLNTSLVNHSTLDDFPNIVYHLEGNLYERGVFLQYELMKSIEKKNIDNAILFLGEGADQVFSFEYYSKIYYYLRVMKKIICNSVKDFNFVKNLCLGGGIFQTYSSSNFLNYIVLKKNGIMMNDINVECFYPYMNQNIVNIAYHNRYKDVHKKYFHIFACRQKIDKDIQKNITKIGGTTEEKTLFDKCDYYNDLEKFAKNSKYNVLNITKNDMDIYFDYLLKIVYLEIFEYMFIKENKELKEISKMKLFDFVKLSFADGK